MDYRALGRTGLKVSPLCLGGNVFGWTADESASFAVLDAFVEGGGNFIDTSNSYGIGKSEEILGRWMADRGNRDHLVVATKVGSKMGDGPNDRGLSRQHIMRAVEASLSRLQTDAIDLYQAHIDDQATPLEETLSAFESLVQQGKVRYLGASNYASSRLAMALGISDRLGLSRYVSLQPNYNLVDRDDFERELEPLCVDQGIGVIPYFSLAAGFLTGKYRRKGALPDSQRAQRVQQRYMTDKGFAALEAVVAVAKHIDAKPAQVALAWLMQRPAVTAPIASGTSPEQVRELLDATELRLDADAIATLDSAGK